MTIPGFPNFWMLEGPTGPIGNLSLITISEIFPLSVSGNKTLQIEMYDNGGGPTDLIGFTLYANDGQLWYSSNHLMPREFYLDFGGAGRGRKLDVRLQPFRQLERSP